MIAFDKAAPTPHRTTQLIVMLTFSEAMRCFPLPRAQVAFGILLGFTLLTRAAENLS